MGRAEPGFRRGRVSPLSRSSCSMSLADVTRALSSLLSFALLMPSMFLLATIAVHRVRVAR